MQENQNNTTVEEGNFNLKRFLFTYLKFWYIYVLALMIGFSCAYFYNWYVKPVFNVSTKILIKDDKSTSIGTQELLKDLDVYNVSKNIENEIEIIKSRKILKKTLAKLEVDVLYYLVGNVKKSQKYTSSPFKINHDSLNFYAYNNLFFITVIDENQFELKYEILQTGENYVQKHQFGEKLNLTIGVLTVNKRTFFDDKLFNDNTYLKRNYQIKFNSIKTNVEFYRAKLSIKQPGKKSSVIVLGIEEQIPLRGIDFLNKLVEVYLENDILEKTKIASSTALFISTQLSTISLELKGIETKRQDFKINRGITDVSAKSQMVLDNVRTKDDERSNLKLQLSFIKYLQNYISEDKNIADIAPSSLGITDPLFNKLMEKIISDSLIVKCP